MSWKPAESPSRIPNWIPLWLHRPIKWAIRCAVVLLVLGICISLFYLYLAGKYDLDEVAKMPASSVMLDRHGAELAILHGENRRVISHDDIPEVLRHALYAREDLRFEDHIGVDAKGLLRATKRNLEDGSFTQGASTLTMQLTRNTYELRAKSLHRKLLEIAITLRIENRYEKPEILAHYLNRIYFGSGCHGIEQAAQTYFGRSVTALNTGEIALLVGIIRGPHLFSPFRNLKGAKDQRDEVLERMYVCGFLSKQEKDDALAMPLRLISPQDRYRTSSYPREYIRKQLQAILEKNDIRQGGLKIHTTLDISQQNAAETSLLRFAKLHTDSPQAALIILDPQSGAIRAYCGGTNYATSPYDRGRGAMRDLGGAFTPFLTAMVLERRKIPIAGQPIQMGRQLGVPETKRLAKRFGFKVPHHNTEDIFRGSVASSPLQLASATSMRVSQGFMHNPYMIERITNEKGETIYEHRPEGLQAISQAAAKECLQAEPVATNLTVTPSRRDAWGVVARKNEVTVLWFGYDQPKSLGTRNGTLQLLRQTLKNLAREQTSMPSSR